MMLFTASLVQIIHCMPERFVLAKNGVFSVNKIQSYFLVSFGSFIIRASTFQLPGAELDPRAEMGPAWAGITF